jgi:hypothetical protein
MSYKHEIVYIENNVLTLVVHGYDGGYVPWKRGLSKEVGADKGVYFEYDAPSNGSYNIVMYGHF